MFVFSSGWIGVDHASWQSHWERYEGRWRIQRIVQSNVSVQWFEHSRGIKESFEEPKPLLFARPFVPNLIHWQYSFWDFFSSVAENRRFYLVCTNGLYIAGYFWYCIVVPQLLELHCSKLGEIEHSNQVRFVFSFFRLTEKFHQDRLNNSRLCEVGLIFVETMSKLLSRLLDYRSVIQSEDNINNRMSCTVNILVGSSFPRGFFKAVYTFLWWFWMRNVFIIVFSLEIDL